MGLDKLPLCSLLRSFWFLLILDFSFAQVKIIIFLKPACDTISILSGSLHWVFAIELVLNKFCKKVLTCFVIFFFQLPKFNQKQWTDINGCFEINKLFLYLLSTFSVLNLQQIQIPGELHNLKSGKVQELSKRLYQRSGSEFQNWKKGGLLSYNPKLGLSNVPKYYRFLDLESRLINLH